MDEPSTPSGTDSGAPAVDRAASILETLLSAADVRKVYGEALRQGDTLLIPTAEVLAIAGFGLGSGGGTDRGAHGDSRRGGGGGGGGGGRVFARSVAIIVASPEGVRVHPVIDVTKIALAALTAAGFVLASLKGIAKRSRFCRC